jgi:hypothetical protein
VGGGAGSGATGGAGLTAGTGGNIALAGTVNEAGAGGADVVYSGPCPGGPDPVPTWTEHWDGHNQVLSLRDSDPCVALYVDPDMAATDTKWAFDFLSKAWTYNLTSYGQLGTERLYVVLHQGKYLGARAAAAYDPDHDGHSVIDVGADAWPSGSYDPLAAALGALVERSAVPDKQGDPASAIWGDAGFVEIYAYDLYLGLEMAAEAKAAFDTFTPIAQTYPVAQSYWFSDFYYPLWRDHGKTLVLSDFFKLLGQYYPASAKVMAPMNWGEYAHFLSGAAHADVQPQATYAFGWNSAWTPQLAQARKDFPAITY